MAAGLPPAAPLDAAGAIADDDRVNQMVSQSRPRRRLAPPQTSRDRLLARVNKAMLYYHFANKAALYRAILADLFGALAAAVVDRRRGTPEDQVRAFIAAIAAELAARPHFPAIWLREMAEGGRHLDDAVVRSLATVIRTLAAILQDGRAAGRFSGTHPLVTQIGIVAPLLLFAASAPIRERFSHLVPAGLAAVPNDAMAAHVEFATLAALHASAEPPAARAAAPRRPRRRLP